MGCCASVIGELTGIEIPEIDIDMTSVTGSLGELISAIPNSIAEHKQNITSECENLETGQEYVVPNTTMKLKKGASDAEITAAAVMAACGDSGRDVIQESVWEVAEPLVDEALALAQSQAPAPIPEFILEKAKDIFRAKVIDPLVDKAIDKALESALKKSGASAKEIADCKAAAKSKIQPMETDNMSNELEQKTGSWAYGLCGCFGDCCACLKGFLCFPCASCCIYKRAELGNCCCGAFPCCWLPCIGCHACCVTRKLRAKKGIKGSCLGDTCAFIFCPCCQLTRELREVKA